jgi:hypothetical protein
LVLKGTPAFFLDLREELEFFVRNVPHEEFKFLTQNPKRDLGCSDHIIRIAINAQHPSNAL